MKVSQVSKEDMVKMSQILNALKVAKFDGIVVQDMAAMIQSIAWAGELAKSMAETFKSPPPTVITEDASTATQEEEIKIEPAIIKPKKKTAKL